MKPFQKWAERTESPLPWRTFVSRNSQSQKAISGEYVAGSHLIRVEGTRSTNDGKQSNSAKNQWCQTGPEANGLKECPLNVAGRRGCSGKGHLALSPP